MRSLGLQGIRRSNGIRTTIPAKDGKRAGDLLDRDFTADSRPLRRLTSGTPEDALDTACGLYLADPTAWLTNPGRTFGDTH